MNRKLVLIIALTLLVGVLSVAFNVQRAKATGTIYIRADGSIDPPDAPITTVDYVTYTLTGNISSDYHGIVVERSNIIIDGAGYTVEGAGAWESSGIYLGGRSNVTIENMEVGKFYWGIKLEESSNNTIQGNNITNNWAGIGLSWSSNNFLRDNNMVGNNRNFGVYGYEYLHFVQDVDSSNTVDGKFVYYWVNVQNATVPSDAGYVALVNCTSITVQNLNLTNNIQCILLAFSENSTITGSNIINDGDGIGLHGSSNNIICGNNVTANKGYGIWMRESSNNSIVQNNLISCSRAVDIEDASNNEIVENNIEYREWGVRLSHASNNTLRGNNITGIFYPYSTGVYLYGSLFNSISQNTIKESEVGMELIDSSGNRIAENNLTENFYGMLLKGSQANSLIGNNIAHSPMISERGNETRRVGIGILISYTYYSNLLRNNSIAGYMYNFGMENGYYFQDIDASNTVDGRPIYYWVNRQNSEIPSDAGYVAIINSTNIRVEGLDLRNNYQGIFIAYSNNVTICENNITNSYIGLYLGSELGNNIIYHNNFISNMQQVYFYQPSSNIWDDGYPSGGNYWSDHTDDDVKSGPSQDLPRSDGMGDTPFTIDADNVDHYPLMNPYGAPPPPAYSLTITSTVDGTTDPSPGTYSYTANSTVQITAFPEANYLFDHWELDSINVGSSITYIVLMDKNHTLQAVFYIIGDINRDGTVDIKDLVLFVKAFGSYPTHTRWNPKADLNNDEKVDIKDLVLVIKHFGEHYP
jgi:parallel beta-helix repeat protein